MWVREIIDANQQHSFAVGNDRNRMLIDLRTRKTSWIGEAVRIDLLINFPDMNARFTAFKLTN